MTQNVLETCVRIPRDLKVKLLLKSTLSKVPKFYCIWYKIVLYFTYSFLQRVTDWWKQANKKHCTIAHSETPPKYRHESPKLFPLLETPSNMPMIRICPLPLNLTEDSSGSLKCKITGSDLPSLLCMESWFKKKKSSGKVLIFHEYGNFMIVLSLGL